MKTIANIFLTLTDPQITRLTVCLVGGLLLLTMVITRWKDLKFFYNQTAQVLRASNDLNNAQFLPLSILTVDKNNKIMQINSAVEDDFGYTEEELKNKDISIILRKGDIEPFRAFKTRAKKGFYYECDVVRKNGETFAAKITTGKWTGYDGKTHYYPVIIIDISHRKATERTIRDAWEMQGKIAAAVMNLLEKGEEIAGTGSWHWDLLTKTVNVSKGFRRVYNISALEEVTSDYLMGLIYPDDQANVARVINEAFDNLKDYSVTYRRLQNNGQVKRILCKGQCILNDEKDEVVKIYGTIQLIENGNI